MRYGVSIFLLILITFTLCACMTKTLNIQVKAAEKLNMDEQSHSLPVTVRIYQLNSDNKFKSSSFYELWQNPKNALDDTLLSQDEFVISPGDEKTIKFHKMENVAYIGAIGVFRTPSDKHWQILEKVSQHMSYVRTYISLRLIDSHIYLASDHTEEGKS